MNAAYRTADPAASLFDAADALYAGIKQRLSSDELRGSTEPDVERELAVEQRELMRLLLEAHLTLRGQEVAGEPVVGADGVVRSHERADKERRLETLFGTVVVKRTGYSGRAVSTLYPVDADLNLPPSKYSLEVERQTALLAARTSFDATIETLSELSGANVPKRQSEEIVRRAASDFGVFYGRTQQNPATPTSELLVLSIDQKGVVLRPEDLTAATRKAAEGSRRKLETRGSKGEPRRGRKRMSTVAAVYTVAPHVRSAQDVIAGLRHLRQAERQKRPRPEGKRVWASLKRPPQEIIRDLFDEANTRDPEHKKRWLVTLDGDQKLARWVRAEARRIGVQVTLVLDFIHALEYVWRAAHVFFEEGSADIEAWVLGQLERILRGEISKVVAGMTRMATVRRLDKKQRAPVDNAARYLLRRKAMMQYDEMLALGAPIASGIIEGACRHLVNDRLDVTGARWSLAGAEAVLSLRSLLASGDFADYWEFHEAAEAARNHLVRYANDRVPPTRRPTRHTNLRLVPAVD